MLYCVYSSKEGEIPVACLQELGAMSIYYDIRYIMQHHRLSQNALARGTGSDLGMCKQLGEANTGAWKSMFRLLTA